MSTTKLKLVYIEWEDPFSSCDGWTQKKDFKPRLASCQSVGWLYKENKDTITLVSHMSDDEWLDGDLTIHKSSIRKRKTLKC